MWTNKWTEAFPCHQINGATKTLLKEINQPGKVPEVFLSILVDNKNVVVTAVLIITSANRTKNAKLGHPEFPELFGVLVYHFEEFGPSCHGA